MPRCRPSVDVLNALLGCLAYFRTLNGQRLCWSLQVPDRGIAVSQFGHCSLITGHIKDSTYWASAEPKPPRPLVPRIIDGMLSEARQSFQLYVTTISLLLWLVSSNFNQTEQLQRWGTVMTGSWRQTCRFIESSCEAHCLSMRFR